MIARRESPRSRKIAWISEHAFLCLGLSLGVYYIVCIRTTHFREWQYGADVKEMYRAIRDQYRAKPGEHVPASWRYAAVLNFYNRLRAGSVISEFEAVLGGDYPENRPAYVLALPHDGPVLKREELSVSYHGQRTGRRLRSGMEITTTSVAGSTMTASGFETISFGRPRTAL